MTPFLSHFALNATDVPASMRFYESVFGWTFVPWGPPGFFQIISPAEPTTPIIGAIQQSRTFDGIDLPTGVECTFAVDDVDATAGKVRAAGGALLMERFTISGVGHLIFFADPDGTPIGAMQYDSTAE